VNEENGLLVENENPQALAEGLKWMMQNAGQFDSKKLQKRQLINMGRQLYPHNIYDCMKKF
jgi:hypothetical protein